MDPRGDRAFFAEVENPGAGSPDYRKSKAYFDQVLQLREILASMGSIKGGVAALGTEA